MIEILARVFGCSHKRTTFPLSRTKTSEPVANSANVAYVVCLECGTEFDYNWQTMKIGKPAVASPIAPPWNVPKVERGLSAAMLGEHQASHAVSN